MAEETVGVAELSDQERRRLGSAHPEIRRGDSAMVVAASRPVLSAIRDFARRIALEEEQSDRILEAMTADVDVGVLDEARVLQLRRQAEARGEFLKEFATLSSHEVAEMNRSAASNTAALASRWKSTGKVFALSVGRADRYPAFQFGDDGKPLPVVAEVIRIFEGRSSWALALWFASHSGWLGGRRPVDVLTTHPDEVVDAARRAVEPLDI